MIMESRFEFLVGAWDFSLFKNIQTVSGFHLFSEKKGHFYWVMKLTVHLHLVQKLRMSGAVPSFCLVPSWCAFFLQNVLQLHQQRWVILRVDSLALWKINNEEDAVLIPKNRDENFSSGFLDSEFFGAGWAAMLPLHWLLLCWRVIVI